MNKSDKKKTPKHVCICIHIYIHITNDAVVRARQLSKHTMNDTFHILVRTTDSEHLYRVYKYTVSYAACYLIDFFLNDDML